MIAQQHQRNEREIGGIEYVFAAKSNQKLAADREARGKSGEHYVIRA